MKSMTLYRDNYCDFDFNEDTNKIYYSDMSMTFIPMSFEIGSFIADKYSKSIYHGCRLLDILNIIRKRKNQK